MSSEGFEINIKCSSFEKLTVPCEPASTVMEVKTIIASKINAAIDSLKLIYKGKVLKDDVSLEHYGVQNGETVHLYKSGAGATTAASSSASTTSTSFAGNSAPSMNAASANSGNNSRFSAHPSNSSSSSNGANQHGTCPLSNLSSQWGQMPNMDISQMQQQFMQNPEMMQSILNSPLMESMLNNPDMMSSMLLNNPQMQAMLDANPHVRHILSDPALMRQSFEMMRNPAAMQAAMRSQDIAMSQLENHPEGYNALRRMFEEVQEPMMQATQEALGGANAGASPWGAAGNNPTSNAANTTTPNTSALPNPWGAPRQAGNNGAFGGGGMPNPWGMPAAGTGAAGVGGAANPFAAFGGMGAAGGGANPYNMDPATISAMMQNPMMQQMLSNPQIMQQVIASNPQLRAMAQSNPEILTMLSNPDVIRQMSNPQTIQAAMQMESSLRQLQAAGLVPPGTMPAFPGAAAGGFTPNMFRPAQQPPSSNVGGLDFSSILGGGAGFNARAHAPPAFPPADPAVRFASQLQQLENMGFNDREANVRALVATNGNVNAAIDRLLGA